MELLRRAFQRIKALFTRSSTENDMEKEMRLHLDSITNEYEQAGMSPGEARLAAQRRFGNLVQLKEKGRDVRGAGILADILQDLQYGFRTLRKAPAFTAVVVFSVAIGIGANAALFSVFDAMFLTDIPVSDPAELVTLGWQSGPSPKAFTPSWTQMSLANGPQMRSAMSARFPRSLAEKLQAKGETLSDLAVFSNVNTDAVIDGRAEEVTAQVVSGNFFRTLGVRPLAGRAITVIDDDPTSPNPVVVISYGFWKKRFALDPGVVGKRIMLNGNLPFTIVGVTASDFHMGWGSSPDLTVPLALGTRLNSPLAACCFGTVGRMKSGVSLDQVRVSLESELLATAREGEPDLKPEDMPHLRVVAASHGFTSDVVLARINAGAPDSRFILLIVLGAVFLALLFVVCLNIANLLIARAAARQYEMGVRLAMGASRRRLIRQLLTESAMLAVLGGALGILFAFWGKDLLLLFLRPDSRTVLELRISPAVLGFSLAASVLTGVIFGLLPALRATRMPVNSAVKQGARTLKSGRGGMGRTLLVTQVAMSVVLLAGAGLLLRSLGKLPSSNTGMNTANLVAFNVNTGVFAKDREGYEQVIDTIQRIPGVAGSTVSMQALLATGGQYSGGFHLKADPRHSGSRVRVNNVRPNYFETLGISIVRGRTFRADEGADAPRVAIVTAGLVRDFPGDPLGERVSFQDSELEIVGVVRDVGLFQVGSTYGGQDGIVFLPEMQQLRDQVSFPDAFEVRTSGDPLTLIPEIRSKLRDLKPDLRVSNVALENDLVEAKLGPIRRMAMAWGLFSAVALLLTSIGLYGLLSYNVALRTGEIGIRLALGAQKHQVIRLVMTQVLTLLSIGLVVGLALSMVLNQVLAFLIYDLNYYDPATFAVVVITILVIAVTSGYLPARRASRVDPTIALRHE